jgi:hypothetical protein
LAFTDSGPWRWLRSHFAAEAMQGMARQQGAPSPAVTAPLTGAVIIVSGLAVIFGVLADVGALLITGFLFLTAFIIHAFGGLGTRREESPRNAHVVSHNVARRNGDDGIDVENQHTTVTSNLASRNFDLGIEAVAGVTDGGGNIAFGNGGPRRYLNVACR